MLKYSPVNTVIDKFAQWFWEPLGVEPAAASPAPCCLDVASVRPALVEPSPVPKAKPRRAHGPRVIDGVNLAVMRAFAAAQHYLSCRNRDTLAESARVYNSNPLYTRAAADILVANEVFPRAGSQALQNAAIDGAIPLLVAADLCARYERRALSQASAFSIPNEPRGVARETAAA